MRRLAAILLLLCLIPGTCLADSRAVGFTRVLGSSMNDTLDDGELVMTARYDYDRLVPVRFDVVICHYPGRMTRGLLGIEYPTEFVKRLVGLPGDTVELRDGWLYVNGECCEEPYINDAYRTGYNSTYAPRRLPDTGDIITVSGGVLTLNGELVSAPLSYGPVTVDGIVYEIMDGMLYMGEASERAPVTQNVILTYTGEPCYFVLGDHRNNSNDSRNIGPLPQSMIVNRVNAVIWGNDRPIY